MKVMQGIYTEQYYETLPRRIRYSLEMQYSIFKFSFLKNFTENCFVDRASSIVIVRKGGAIQADS